MKTVKELVDKVHQAAVAMGMDLSPKDVGTIIGLFLEGMASAEPIHSESDEWLRRIADECGSVRDE